MVCQVYNCLCKASGLHSAFAFLGNLAANQDTIGRNYTAWLGLPLTLFGNNDSKLLYRRRFARHGIYRNFVRLKDNSSLATFQALSHKQFAGDRRVTTIIQQWASFFHTLQRSVKDDQRVSAEDTDTYQSYKADATKRNPRRGRLSHTQYAKQSSNQASVVRSIDTQKQVIQQAFKVGQRERGMEYVRQLVEYQKKHSTPTQTAKSLCHLAQYAKDLGSSAIRQLAIRRQVCQTAPSISGRVIGRGRVP